MSTATAAQPALAPQPVSVKTPPVGSRERKPISWEHFQRRYLRREDGFKYEWGNGLVVKSKRSMDKTQLYILENLLLHFDQLKVKGKVSGRLIPEPDLFFLAQHRRPDIAWLTTQQIYALADPAAYEVPAFLIEVISSNDYANLVKKKMVNYRDAGVQVVWHIYPGLKEVEVYAGPKLSTMTVCSGEKICSAAPVLPDFQISVNAIFDKPL